jgi:lipase chaperone LimK
MRARRLALAGAAGVALVAALLAAGLRTPAPPLAGPAGPAGAVVPPRAVSSLAGTTPGGSASAAADQSLVLEPGLIRLFDYWLTTVGERPLDAIRADVELDLDHRLAPRAAARAKDLFGRYLKFKTALKDMHPPRAPDARSVDVLRAGLRSMLALRATFFSDAEAQALFAPQDDEARAALARMEIEQDPALDATQRAQKLAALDVRLSPAERAERDAPLAVVRLNEAAATLRATGGSDDDVWHLRAAATSPEAANRLADLDRDEAAWQARIAQYQAQRDAALAGPGSDEARQAAVAALRDRLFDAQEQRRLGAYGG